MPYRMTFGFDKDSCWSKCSILNIILQKQTPTSLNHARKQNTASHNTSIAFLLPTITNEKGRLSQEEIDRMVKEAEEFVEEDQKVTERIDARNKLETYVYTMRSTIGDKDKLADKIDSDDKEKIESTLKEALDWLDDNPNAEKEDFDEKLKEVEAVCNPVIKQVYEKSGGSSAETEDEEPNDEL